MEKLIFRDDEKKDQEVTQDCQRSIPSTLDPRHSEQPSDFTKFKVSDFRDICVILTAPHRHSSFLDILSYKFLPEKQTSLFVIYCLINVFQ